MISCSCAFPKVNTDGLTRSEIGGQADAAQVCDAAHASDAVERSTSYSAGQKAYGRHSFSNIDRIKRNERFRLL